MSADPWSVQQLCSLASLSISSHAAVPAGERIQLHRMGSKFEYWSRNNKEHGVQSSYHVMNAVAALQIKPENCILDGEFIVWNKSRSGPDCLTFVHTALLRAQRGGYSLHSLQQSVQGFTNTKCKPSSLGLLPACCCHAAT